VLCPPDDVDRGFRLEARQLDVGVDLLGRYILGEIITWQPAFSRVAEDGGRHFSQAQAQSEQ